MVWYDFVILAILLYTAWSGAARGLISQLAWIAAIVLCFKFADKLSPSIEPAISVESPELKHWIAMFILYIGFSLASFMAARVLNSWLTKAKLKDFDRHLGALFGLLKGMILSLVLTFFAVTLSTSLKETVMSSHTGMFACYALDRIEPLTPQYFPEFLQEWLSRAREEIHDDLGHEVHDIFGGGSSDAEAANSETPGGDAVPWDFGTAAGTDSPGGVFGNAGESGSSPNTAIVTFQQVLSSLPRDLRDQLGGQLKQKWDLSTTSEKQSLAQSLKESASYRIPDVLESFLGARRAAPVADSGTLQQLLRAIPAEHQARFGRQLEQQWAVATSQQKQELVRTLEQSFNYKIPDVISDFLAKTSESRNNTYGGQGGRSSDAPTTADLLNRIGDIYRDRDTIVYRTTQHLRGVPQTVQDAVIEDWYADLTSAVIDPDRTTTRETRLDDRILQQLSKAGIRIDRLDNQLQQRLRLSLR